MGIDHVNSLTGSLGRALGCAVELCDRAVAVIEISDGLLRFAWVNSVYERLTGFSVDELLGQDYALSVPSALRANLQRDVLDLAQRSQAPVRLSIQCRKDGGAFLGALTLQLVPHANHEPVRLIVLVHCIGEVPQLDQALALDLTCFSAQECALLPNLSSRLHEARSVGMQLALLLVDLGPCADPRTWLDQLALPGHIERMHLPGGGVSLLIDVSPQPHQILRTVTAAVQGLRAFAPHCCIGVCVASCDDPWPLSILGAAKVALRSGQARQGQAGTAFDDAELDQLWLKQYQLERDLQDALSNANTQFQLLYQPLIELEGGWLTGFEALVRWVHPQHGRLDPDAFIPLASACGLMDSLDDWVLESALLQLKSLDLMTLRPLRMTVNVSARQLRRPGFATHVANLLRRLSIAPSQLELEITERTLADDDSVLDACLRDLHRLNVRLSIDDFGTGASSLQRLTLLPIHVIKIDRSFTQLAMQGGSALAVARMMCELAHALHLQVVVKGVEAPGEVALFRQLGASHAQGFLISKPLPEEDMRELTRRQQPIAPRSTNTGQPHLLMLDDEAHIISALRRCFRREGWEVHGTTSPAEAFQLLAQHPIGVVLCDQRMPEMNGTEFLRKVLISHPQAVRILLTGYSEVSAVTSAINEGAVWKVLAKPWDDEQLRRDVQQAFELYREQAAEARKQTEAHLQAEALRTEAAHLRDQLSRQSEALDASRAIVLDLPIALIGLDPQGSIVLSNQAADQLFARGLPLLGDRLSTSLPAELSALLPAGGKLDWQGQCYAVHVQALPGSTGQLLCVVRAP